MAWCLGLIDSGEHLEAGTVKGRQVLYHALAHLGGVYGEEMMGVVNSLSDAPLAIGDIGTVSAERDSSDDRPINELARPFDRNTSGESSGCRS